MNKVIVLLTKKDGMTREDFRHYWREVHGPMGARMPGVRRYVQNHALADGAPYDGIAEMWFDSPADMQAAFTSEAASRGGARRAEFPGRAADRHRRRSRDGACP